MYIYAMQIAQQCLFGSVLEVWTSTKPLIAKSMFSVQREAAKLTLNISCILALFSMICICKFSLWQKLFHKLMSISLGHTWQRNFLRGSFHVWPCGRYGYKAGVKAQETLYYKRIDWGRERQELRPWLYLCLLMFSYKGTHSQSIA